MHARQERSCLSAVDERGDRGWTLARVFAGGLFAMAVGVQSVTPAVIIVDGSDSTVVADGVCSLREALNNANSDADTTGGDCAPGSGADTIQVLTDVTLTDLDHTTVFTTFGTPAITSEVAIEGNGFTVARDSAAEPFGLFDVQAGGALTMTSITVSGGDAVYGGGIYSFRAPVVADDINVTGNSASSSGAGLYIFGGGADLILTNSTVSGNTSELSGGGIAVGGYGPGDDATADISGTVISGNYALAFGGGVANYGQEVTIADSTLSGNDAFAGGAVSSDAVAAILRTTISDNSATYGGGLSTTFGGSVVLTDATVSNNMGVFRGGGLYGDPTSSISLVNATLSGNTAGLGGGVYNLGDTEIRLSTFLGGDAPSGGGILTAGDGVTTFEGTIVAGTLGGGDCVSADAGSVVDAGGNFSEDASCPGSPIVAGIDIDLMLADNGGPTGTHALLAGSAAIDAVPACRRRSDQRDRIRGPACDGGAFEFGAPQSPTLTATGECPGIYTVSVSGATPNGQVVLVGGAMFGHANVPMGSCQGARLEVENPVALGVADANASGDATFEVDFGAGACGRFIEALDSATCRASVPVELGTF